MFPCAFFKIASRGRAKICYNKLNIKRRKEISFMKKQKMFIVLVITIVVVFILSFLSLIFATWLHDHINVIGIRIAVLIVTFAAFGASAIFSMMVYQHNITVSRINDDNNKRSELFRELQFVSSNYSIIEFNDRMLISPESSWYIPKYHKKDRPSFHLVDQDLDPNAELSFYTIRIPFQHIEGKTTGRIIITKLKFEKGEQKFIFVPMEHEKGTQAYLLFNEKTKRHNMIVNLVFNKSSNFFNEEINLFTKIKISLIVSSVLGVSLNGNSELFFTNPTQTEGQGLHTYKINSSNFIMASLPYLEEDILEGTSTTNKDMFHDR